jgi:hypothetical protein
MEFASEQCVNLIWNYRLGQLRGFQEAREFSGEGLSVGISTGTGISVEMGAAASMCKAPSGSGGVVDRVDRDLMCKYRVNTGEPGMAPGLDQLYPSNWRV